MNKIDEYKKKMNYDVWEDVTKLQRKLFQDGILEYHASNSLPPRKSEGDQE